MKKSFVLVLGLAALLASSGSAQACHLFKGLFQKKSVQQCVPTPQVAPQTVPMKMPPPAPTPVAPPKVVQAPAAPVVGAACAVTVTTKEIYLAPAPVRGFLSKVFNKGCGCNGTCR